MYHILLPVDTEEDRAIASAKAIAALPDAAESIRVTVLNVQERVNATDGDAHIDSSNWYDPEVAPVSMQRATQYLEESGLSVDGRREHADPSEAIVEIAHELDVDQIVMSGRKRTRVGKVLFGSITQSVLLSADIPVMVVLDDQDD